MLGKTFSKILSRFGLSSTSRSSGSSTDIKLKGSHESHVALIGERGNHKTESVTEILVTIGVIGLNTLYSTVFILPVVTELLHPLEGSRVRNFIVNKPLGYFLSVHINNDESTKSQALEFVKFLLHELYSLQKLGIELLGNFGNTSQTTFESVFNISGPVNLGSIKHTLARMLLNPFISRSFCVV